MKRISQCRTRSSKGLRDRKCPEAEGWNKKNIRPNGFQVKSDAEMTTASWVSSGSRRPPLPSSRTPSTELEQQFGEWKRREVMALRPLENNLLSQSTQLQASPPPARDLSSGWLEGHGNDSGSCLSCVCLADGICNMTMDSNSMTIPMSDPNPWATAMNNLGMPPIGISGQQLMPGTSILRFLMLTYRETDALMAGLMRFWWSGIPACMVSLL